MILEILSNNFAVSCPSSLLLFLNINITYDPNIPLFDICPRDSIDTFSAIFTATLFTIPRKQKASECSSIDACITKGDAYV